MTSEALDQVRSAGDGAIDHSGLVVGLGSFAGQGLSPVPVHAEGVTVHFSDGRSLLDGASGLWNVILGHGNPAVTEALVSAITDVGYLKCFETPNLYAISAAQRLLAAAPTYTRVIFGTSGASGVEIAIKVARQFAAIGGSTQKNGIVTLRDSWHGLSLGASPLTGQNVGQSLYSADRRYVVHTDVNDVEALAATFRKNGERICAVVVEPIMGTGAVTLSAEFLEALLSLRAQYGFLLVADEVTTGFWRTGPLLASFSWPEPPDVAVVSKGLTNGTCAASAVLVAERPATTLAQARAVLGHGETQAGTPPSCAAIIAVLGEGARIDAPQCAKNLEDRIRTRLHRLTEREEAVTGFRGCGAMFSIDVVGAEFDGAGLLASIRIEGALVHKSPRGLQIMPALTYTSDQVDGLFNAIESGIRMWSATSTSQSTPPRPGATST